jgi:hypothetical protein
MTDDHWTDEDHHQIKMSPTLRHMADVGTVMIRRLRQRSLTGNVALLSGPMTSGGLENFEANMELFGHCIQLVRERGIVVFNQLPFQNGMIRILGAGKKLNYKPGDTDYPQNIMDDFYWPLLQAGDVTHLMLLPTWVTSNGSTQEVGMALRVGTVAIEEMDEDYYNQALARMKSFHNHAKAS